MRTVIINETFSPRMGYLGTMLSKYLARAGVEIHVVTTDLPPYHGLSEFKDGLPDFLKSQALVAGTVTHIDGYTVHVLGHERALGHVYIKGLAKKLRELKPDVVYSVLAIGWIPLASAVLKWVMGYKLFTGSHTSALMFPATSGERWGLLARFRNLLTRWMPGRVISLTSVKCYCPTADCGDVAWKFFGVQKSKIEIVHLGIDAEFFYAAHSEADRASRREIRARFGFNDADVVCIYTGKLTDGKNALLLAQAVNRLSSQGRRFRGLFIGDGAQRPAIETMDHCVVLDFVVFSELGGFYRASDIAVWLTNESTSMLDAAACGIPIIVSDRIYQDHVTGNGLAYRMNDLDDLCQKLLALEDAAVRARLGAAGAAKMRNQFSWERIAAKRLRDFSDALGVATESAIERPCE